ncbi:MAG: hypothetical protein KGP28_03800 [Bdellovibrionales bacterium]|nr:hypothetical protein [Bdellovibrionales bacterium]
MKRFLVLLFSIFPISVAQTQVILTPESQVGMGAGIPGMGNPLQGPGAGGMSGAAQQPVPSFGSLPNQCPYLEKSADAKNLLNEVSKDITSAIAELQKKGNKCALQGTNLIGQMQTFNDAINQLAQQRIPDQRAMTNLMIGGEPFPCGPNNQEFTYFLSQYARGRVIEKLGLASPESALGGAYGNRIEETIETCMTSAARTSTSTEASELGITQCTYSELFGDGTGSRSIQGSWAANAWNNDCGNGSASTVNSARRGIEKQEDDLETSRQNFRNALNSVTTQFSTISGSISAIPDQQCAAAKQLLLGATQAGLGVTAALTSPVGAIGAGFLSQILSSSIQALGTNQKKISRLQNTEEAIKNSNRTLFQNFSCHIFKTNQLNCELLTRSQMKGMNPGQAQFNSCQSDSQVRSNLLMIGKIRNDLKEYSSNGQVQPSQSAPDKAAKPGSPTEEQIDYLYKKFFSNKEDFGLILPNGTHISTYDYLYKEPNGLISSAIKTFSELKPGDDRKTVKMNATIEKSKFLKARLDEFKQKMTDFQQNGEFDPIGKDGKNVVSEIIASVQAGQYLDAVGFYLKDRASIPDTEENKNFGISKSLAEDMETTFENRIFERLGPEIPDKKSESNDLRTTITDIYDNFLGQKSIIKDRYVNGHRAEAWKQIQEEFKNGIGVTAGRETIKNKELFSTNVVYAAITHCSLNYPFALNEDGTKLDQEYMKQCGFLKACKGSNNTIGWPIDLSSQNQAKIKSHSIDEFGMCSMVNNFKSIETRLEKEFKKNGTICGKSVFEIESFR